MTSPLHTLDAQLASLDDAEIETLWRAAVARDDREAAEPLLRQLVLRALPVLEGTCARRGKQVGMSEADVRVAVREAAVRLMLRLAHDTSQRIMTLASDIAGEIVDDPARRRRPQSNPFTQGRPPLQVVRGGASRRTPTTKETDHGRS